MVQDEDGKPLAIDDVDSDAIQAKVGEVEQSMHAISAKLYEAAASEMENQTAESGDDDDDVVDADFEVVDED